MSTLAPLGLTRTATAVLEARGHTDPIATRAFLDPKLADLTPPHAMVDREAAVDRLAHAVRKGERVVVFGDYDVDGITATAVLASALAALGAPPLTVLASRYDGGYGFSARALERVKARGPALLVTCDCGSSDAPRLAALREASIDAIVIDHHLVPEGGLPVRAFLNPHRPECGFPFKHLASVGLALSVAAGLRAALGAALDLRPLLDLVALGTVADVAPLEGDNRALVRAGLRRIETAPRPGVEALVEAAGLRAGASIGGEDVAFKLAPRINAPGRLGAPDLSLQLLLSTDVSAARGLAAQVEEVTKLRRTVERDVLDQALAEVERTGQGESPAIVVGGEGWNVGVVGIVAARLVDRYQVPAIVIAFEGEEGRGSARGPKGARLYDGLVASKETMLGFGGHQAAAGVHLRRDRLDALREAFAAAHAHLPRAVRGAAPRVDADLDPSDDLSRVVRDLSLFEPTGEGQPYVRLRVADARVVSARIMKAEHLRLVVDHGGRLVDAFGYGLAHLGIGVGDHVDLIGSLRRDAYRGGSAVELRVLHAARRGA